MKISNLQSPVDIQPATFSVCITRLKVNTQSYLNLNMERWMNKVVVVTGASAGIGLATAKAFKKHGLTVVGLARRKDKMEKEMESAEGTGKFYPIQCDVAKANEVAEAFNWIKNNLGTVNILINNAGTGIPKSIEDSEIEDLEKIMNINVMGLIYCTKQAIKMMKENGQDAHIVNICSILGHKVSENKLNVYAPSKFAVKALSQTCINELLDTKIRVSNISPGLVRTEITASIVSKIKPLDAEDVADSIIHVVSAPQHVLISELIIKPLGEKV